MTDIEFYDDELPDRPLSKKELEAQRAKKRVSADKELRGDAPPIPFEPRCKACRSPYRHFIDAMLIRGASYVSISERIPGEDGERIDRRSVSNHAKNHLGYQEDALRKMLEDEATQAQQNYEEGVRGAFTHRGILETALRKFYDDLLAGVITVESRDAMNAIQMLTKMNDEAQQVAVDQMRAELDAFIQAIRQTVDEDTWIDIANRARINLQQGGMAALPIANEAEVVNATVVRP